MFIFYKKGMFIYIDMYIKMNKFKIIYIMRDILENLYNEVKSICRNNRYSVFQILFKNERLYNRF